MFSIETRVLEGFESSLSLSKICVENGWTEIAVVIDSAVFQTSRMWPVFLGHFGERVQVRIHDLPVSNEPTYPDLDNLISVLGNWPSIDAVIGIGGGSTMDLVKAAAALRNESPPAIGFRGFDRIVSPGLPSVCIPTTAGTGSEITPNAVFIDLTESLKLGINGKHVAAEIAVLDSAWLLDCPASVLLSSGLDALVHSIESYISTKASRLSRLYSQAAFDLIVQNFVDVVLRPSREALEAMLIASNMAGIALMNSGSGATGAISYPLGVHFGVPHGFAGGIVLPVVLQKYVDRGWDGLAGLQYSRASVDGQESRNVVEVIRLIYRDAGVPEDFSEWGLSLSSHAAVMQSMGSLRQVLKEGSPSMLLNPDLSNVIRDFLQPAPAPAGGFRART